MKNQELLTANFTPKAKLVWMDFETKNKDGKVVSAGSYGIAQCLTPEWASDISKGLNDLKRTKQMRVILEKLVHQLPEMDEEDTPLDGSQAVDVLCNVWQEIKEVLKD